MKVALYVLLAWNLLAFLAFGWDKFRAIRQGRRVPEKNLLGMAFLGGGLGAWIGSRVFRHKTAKPSFYWPLRIALVLNLMAYGAAAWAWFTRP